MILIIQRYIPNYRIDFFDLIKRRNKNIQILSSHNYKKSELYFNKKIVSSNNKMKVFYKLNLYWIPFIRIFYKYKPKIIIIEHNPRILTIIPIMIICKVLKVKFILHRHVGSMKREFSLFNYRDIIHLLLIKCADRYIAYNLFTKNKLLKFIKDNKIFIANNTINLENCYKIKKNLRKIDLKNKYQITYKINLVFLGRIIKEKKLINLVKSFNKLKNKIDLGLVIIGDGPDKLKVEKYVIKNNIKDIRFMGYLSKEIEIAELLIASDIHVCFGYCGLNVVHSMAYGLPTIAFKKSNLNYHSPEFYYLKHENNAYLIKDEDEFELAILKIFENLQIYKNNVDIFAINNLKLNNMADNYLKAMIF